MDVLDVASGALDTTFSPPGATANGFEAEVNALHAAGTSIYAGGGFFAYRGVANSARLFAKLDQTSGAIDTTVSPVGATANGFDNYVFALASATVNGDSALLIGGDFTMYRGSQLARRILAIDPSTGATK